MYVFNLNKHYCIYKLSITSIQLLNLIKTTIMEYIRREVPEEQLSLSGLETKLEASPRWFGAYEG